MFTVRIIYALASLFAFVFFSAVATPDDFNAQLESAGKKLETVMRKADALMKAGDVDGADKKLLSAFPAGSRTAAESFILGNLLFEIDRKLSYELHAAAAKAEPSNIDVAWEWGMEQHRAGEYAGALTYYQQYSKAKPDSAVPYALQ